MAAAKRFSAKEVLDILDESDDSFGSEDDTDCSSSDVEEGESSVSENETCEVGPEFCWRDQPVEQPSRLPFSGSPGRKAALVDVSDVLNYFRLFLTVQMLETITTETNRRAHQLLDGLQKPRSRLVKWVDVDQDELLVLISLLIYQGIIQKPETEMYWTMKPLMETPYVRSIMPEQRFGLLLKCLHFVDDRTLPTDFPHHGEKSFAKIKPFFLAVVHQFSSVYVPDWKIAIDESLMLWKGRLAMKQYIPMKRSRFGVKSYELCECGSGYIWNSIVHTGSHMSLTESPDGLVSSRIVLTLAKDLLGKGYAIYMDNWYSSPSLFQHLREQQTDAVGTVRLNRKNMPAELKKKIGKNQVVSAFSKNLMAMKWMDKREVTMLSTFHNNAMAMIKNRRGEDKQKPVSVVSYTNHMGAVDLADQMLTTYPTERKRRKIWYKKQFCHLLNQMILNAYILFGKENPGSKVNHLQFRIKLVERILEEHHKPGLIPRKGRPSHDAVPLRLTGRHFPKLIPANELKKRPSKRCKVCCSHSVSGQKKARKETRYFCSDCNVPLCVVPCFEMYHTKANY